MTTVYVPCDAAALSVGADEVAAAFAAIDGVTVKRNGSRGLLWAEPLVEVVTERGRIGYANIAPQEARAVLDGGSPRTARPPPATAAWARWSATRG